MLNGGIGDVESAAGHLAHVDGVMMGRAAYQEPWRLLAVDPLLRGEPAPFASPKAAAEALMPYVAREIERGTRLYDIARHLLGLFHAVPGARAFRRHLATEGVKAGAGPEVLRDALALVPASEVRDPWQHPPTRTSEAKGTSKSMTPVPLSI